jgi:hypothetical protein
MLVTAPGNDGPKMIARHREELLRLLSCLVPGPPLADVISRPSSNEHADWMARLADRIADRELGSLAMPGSHDSGTYPITGLTRLSAEFAAGSGPLAALLTALRASPSDPITAAFANWSRTQRHTIGAQLAAGVRYLDLRFIPDPLGQRFVFTHGFGGAELATILEEVRSFVDANPMEIVILDLQHLFSRTGAAGGMAATDARSLVARLGAVFGEKLVARAAGARLKTTRISDLWARCQQVVVVLDAGPHDRLTHAARGRVWTATDALSRYWPRSTRWDGADGVARYLDDHLADANASNRIAVLHGQVTPTPALMVKRVCLALATGAPRVLLACLEATGVAADLAKAGRRLQRRAALSLQDEARATNPELRRWVERNRPQHVVIADYIADWPDLITAIIDSNA